MNWRDLEFRKGYERERGAARYRANMAGIGCLLIIFLPLVGMAIVALFVMFLLASSS